MTQLLLSDTVLSAIHTVFIIHLFMVTVLQASSGLCEVLSAPHRLFEGLTHLALRDMRLGDVGAAAIAECIRSAKRECFDSSV